MTNVKTRIDDLMNVNEDADNEFFPKLVGLTDDLHEEFPDIPELYFGALIEGVVEKVITSEEVEEVLGTSKEEVEKLLLSKDLIGID